MKRMISSSNCKRHKPTYPYGVYSWPHTSTAKINQIQVPTTTTSQDLNAMIGSISRELTISYSDKDLTKKGKRYNDLLHNTVDAKGKRMPMVLIDDGSALNVCPLKWKHMTTTKGRF